MMPFRSTSRFRLATFSRGLSHGGIISAVAVSLIVSSAFAANQSTADATLSKVSNTPLRLTQGGTPEAPAVFDGEGVVIDLGTDVTERDWVKDGDLWTSREALYGPKPIAPGQNTGLFVDEVAMTLGRDLAAERKRFSETGVKGEDGQVVNHLYLPPAALKPGQMGCTPEGLIYFRWPEGKVPGMARVILLPKAFTSGVTIACSHIIVKNITVKYASNDGFNIHGSWVGIKLENIKAFCNADEGISAHDDVQMDVDGAEIAWNGSYDGGVADVDRCVTTYKNCLVHDNVAAAFKFSGKEHRVTDTVIYNQKKDFTVRAGTVFSQERVTNK